MKGKRGWNATVSQASDSDIDNTFSVIVPFRNEIGNIEALCKSLESQSFSKENFEVIFVNDHSEDKGEMVVREYLNKSSWTLIELDLEKGKRAALKKGIEASKNDIIISIDADVMLNSAWLNSINKSMDGQTDMLLNPVLVEKESGFIKNFQFYDYLSLQFVTASSAGLKVPLLSNGANLAFRKEVFNELGGYDDLPKSDSGDDYFLMLKFREKGKRIAYRCQVENIAFVKAIANMGSLISQRIRWAGKSRKANDLLSAFISLSVVLFNVWMICLIALIFLNYDPKLALLFIPLKLTGDAFVTALTARQFQQSFRLNEFFSAFVVYPFYLLIVFTLSFFHSPVWKGRKIRTG